VVSLRWKRDRGQDRRPDHADFNASLTGWKVETQSFPQAAHNDSVVVGPLEAAKASGMLE
jgi:hypothetical protein